MAVDLKSWRNVIEQVVGAIADESLQRRAWFGIGPEMSSPDEHVCQFLGDAAIEDFLDRNDAGLSEPQIKAGRHLIKLMRDLLKETSGRLDRSELIDDPRWRNIREAAASFYKLLQARNMLV